MDDGPGAHLTRRAALLAGVTSLASACSGSAPPTAGRGSTPTVDRRSTTWPDTTGRPTTREHGALVTGTLRSGFWPGAEPRWLVVLPTGVPRPPLVICLHGKYGDAEAAYSTLRVQRYVDELGIAVAAIDGGNYYWHRRDSLSTGDDAISPDTPPCDTGSMVLRDFVPMLARHGLDTSRVGLTGWSMGGYGALLLASRLGPRGCAAVAPMSAALWTDASAAAPGAFDGAGDFERHDVFDRLPELDGIPIRMCCGTDDPFLAGNEAFAATFPSDRRPPVETDFGDGAHDGAYWADQIGDQLGFLAGHLSA